MPQARIKLSDIKVAELEKELEQNKKLIEMTKGDEDGEDSACSDSEPSEDNLEEEEMAKIIPIKPKKKLEPLAKPQPPIKVQVKKTEIPVKASKKNL